MNLRPFRFLVSTAVAALALAGCSSHNHSALPLTVTITNPIAAIVPGDAAVNINATVANDGATTGVGWTLVNAGTTTACAPTCGALSNTTTTSVTYTPPAATPSPAAISLLATSLSDSTVVAVDSFTIQFVSNAVCQPSPGLRGNEALLTQPIAFLVKGMDSDQAPIAYAGSFTPNGSGGITAASLDLVSFEEGTGAQSVSLASSSYSYGIDGRGCLFLSLEQDVNAKRPLNTRNADATAHHPQVKPGARGKKLNKTTRRKANGALEPAELSLTLTFAILDLNGSGRIIEFDNDEGEGSVAAGMMHVQSPDSFSVGSLANNFAFGMDGWLHADDAEELFRLGIAGSFTNAAGTLSNGFADQNIGGGSGELSGGSGSLDSTVSSTTGRGTGDYSSSDDDNGLSFAFAYYIINDTDIYIISTDNPDDEDSFMISGRALASNASSASLNGWYITELSGLNCDGCDFGEPGEGANYVTLSTLAATNAGDATGTAYSNSGGSTDIIPYTGTYTLDSSAGRVAFNNTSSNAVGYLTSGDGDDDVIAFLVGTDSNSATGVMVFQSDSQPNFSTDSIDGNFAFGTGEDIVGDNGSEAGVFNFNDGAYSGTADRASIGGLTPGATGSGTYAMNIDGSGSFNPSTKGQVYIVTSGSWIFGTDAEADQPLLYIFNAQSKEAAKSKAASKKAATKK